MSRLVPFNPFSHCQVQLFATVRGSFLSASQCVVHFPLKHGIGNLFPVSLIVFLYALKMFLKSSFDFFDD